jgi:hypothetical protein
MKKRRWGKRWRGKLREETTILSKETDHPPELRCPDLFKPLAGREAFSSPSLKVDDFW